MFDKIEDLMLVGVGLLIGILLDLVQICAAINAQTKWLKNEDEINSIGNES